jgi:hypothetical protein
MALGRVRKVIDARNEESLRVNYEFGNPYSRMTVEELIDRKGGKQNHDAYVLSGNDIIQRKIGRRQRGLHCRGVENQRNGGCALVSLRLPPKPRTRAPGRNTPFSRTVYDAPVGHSTSLPRWSTRLSRLFAERTNPGRPSYMTPEMRSRARPTHPQLTKSMVGANSQNDEVQRHRWGARNLAVEYSL